MEQDPVSRFTAGFQAFYDELRRRHVFRVAAAYVVGVFVVLQGADLLIQGLPGVPEWVYPTLTVLSLVGFPIALVLGWAFQWTSHGIRREEPAPESAAAEAAVEPGRAVARSGARAFAYVGLGIVIALVGTGLSVPLMYSNDGDRQSLESQRQGIVPAGNDGGVATMAVLPFTSLTGADDSGFADGLAEDITAALAQLGSVNVVSRTTSEAYRDSEKTARVIGAELGVGLILEGTIRRAGNAVRVTVQLIDATRDRHLWASTYDREIDGDVFDVQSELAQEIVAAIQSVVTPTEADQAERRLLASRVADQGAELLSRADPAYDEAAEELFEQALEADSGNSVAHAGIAQTLASRVQVGGPTALLDSAEHHAMHAIRLNPELPDGHAAQAFVFLVRGQMDSATVALNRVVELDETGEFEFEMVERIRMISPEALDLARHVLEGIEWTNEGDETSASGGNDDR